MTHDYKRHGVTTLFAALDVLYGKVIGQCMQQHRHQEFIRFLTVMDVRVPKKKTVHVIVDNYAAHKLPKVLEWIDKHPLVRIPHLPQRQLPCSMASKASSPNSPKSASSAACSDPSKNSKTAIRRFLDDTNAKPKPFTWTKDPNKITRAPNVRFDPLARPCIAALKSDEAVRAISA